MREGLLRIQDRFNSKQALWMTTYVLKWVLLILLITLYTIIVARVSEARASRKYETWQERWVSDYMAQEQARIAGMPADPYELLLDSEAQALAKVLYGVKDNSTDDLRTYCWCVFNRVDSPDYPDTLEEVIAQPSQWMRYSPDSPVLESLYQIARAELDAWHTGTTRPVSNEFVFMNWSPSEITLRDNWTDGSRTHYWRVKG